MRLSRCSCYTQPMALLRSHRTSLILALRVGSLVSATHCVILTTEASNSATWPSKYLAAHCFKGTDNSLRAKMSSEMALNIPDTQLQSFKVRNFLKTPYPKHEMSILRAKVPSSPLRSSIQSHSTSGSCRSEPQRQSHQSRRRHLGD